MKELPNEYVPWSITGPTYGVCLKLDDNEYDIYARRNYLKQALDIEGEFDNTLIVQLNRDGTAEELYKWNKDRWRRI